MRVIIDREGCISCGLCTSTCGDVFRMADDGLAEVYHQPDDAAEEAGAQEAAGSCPVAVIQVEE